MNVNRMTSGTPLARTVAPTRNFDLTITDRGVAAAPPKPAAVSRPEPVRQPLAPAAVQVTSSPTLQALLSPAESDALRQTFAARPGPVATAAVYGLRGTNLGGQTRASLGGLMDMVG